jgi:integrase
MRAHLILVFAVRNHRRFLFGRGLFTLLWIRFSLSYWRRFGRVPTHKTGTAFTKPVDPILGQAIDAWQAVRPTQPGFTDRRTGERVDLLFAARARGMSTAYINNTVIPMFCRKAGVPAVDVRGAITSHRARSTIASQLYNAKEPMTMFELQAWLGHRSPQSTQYYTKISPTRLTRAYQDAGTSPATCAPSKSSSTAMVLYVSSSARCRSQRAPQSLGSFSCR